MSPSSGHGMLGGLLAGLRWGVILGALDGIAVAWWYQAPGRLDHFFVLVGWSALLLGGMGIGLALVLDVGLVRLGRGGRTERERAAMRDGLLLTVLTGSVGLITAARGFSGLAAEPSVIAATVVGIGIVAMAVGYAWWRAGLQPGTFSVRLYRRLAGLILIVVLVGTPLGLLRSPAEEPNGRPPGATAELPDVVLILLDTVRADHLEAYGHVRSTMPRTEEFFAPGVRFGQASAHVSYTGPSTMSLMTGKHPLDLGVLWNGYPLSGDVPVLAEALTRKGYQTGAVIASAPLSAQWSGLDRGFQHYDDELHPLQRIHGLLRHTTLPVLVSRISGASGDHRDAAAVNRAAFAWLKRLEEAAPFFLWAHYFDPHAPYEPPREYALAMGADANGARSSRPLKTLIADLPDSLNSVWSQQLEALYEGSLLYTDRHVRALLDRVAALHRDRPTLYILTADHGETLTEVWETGWAADHGRYVKQREIWVPLFVRGAGFEGPRAISTPVGLMDIVPTLQSYLGLAVGENLQGVDLLQVMRDEVASGAMVYRPPLVSVAAFDAGVDPVAFAARIGNLKLIERPAIGEYALYDVANDPHEQTDLSDRFPDALLAAQRVLAGLPELLHRESIDPSTKERLRSLGYIQ